MITPSLPSNQRNPPTEAEMAAIEYEQKYHWPCGARDEHVWIHLPAGVGTLLVDPPYTLPLHRALLDLDAHGPITQWPGRPASWLFFVLGPAQPDDATRKVLYRYGALYRGSSRPVVVPPSRDPTGPHTWISPPTGFGEFPKFDIVLASLCALSQ